MNKQLLKPLVLALISVFLTAGCRTYVRPPPATVYVAPPPAGVDVVWSGEVVVTQAPPPPVFELMPRAPGLGMMWIGGAYVWDGHWVWTPGHWDRPPHPGAVWIPHHYEFRNGRHIFIRGGWR